MAAPDRVPVELLRDDDFARDCAPEDLVYFLLNVGDGDTQLVLLPADSEGRRGAIVVDVATTRKLPWLVETLAEIGLLRETSRLFPLVVGTHPHEDHIGGMPEFLDRFGSLVSEYWEPGYYHPSASYLETMRALEEHEAIQHSQPTSGFTRFIGRARVMVLSPTIALRNRRYLRLRRTQALLLGADAQTLTWGQVMNDFPELRPSDAPVAKALRMALGADPLRATVFKVPHHASKHGVTLELVEMIKPRLSLISSTPGGGRYNFPHTVALESVREALEAIASSGTQHRPDHELGIHYTCTSDAAGAPLGSIAIVLSPNGQKRHLWRFGDRPGERIELAKTRRFVSQERAEAPIEDEGPVPA